MNRDIDLIFEKAMCDSWWMQDNGIIVQRPEVTYLTSRHDERLYNAVIRVSPQYKDIPRLVNEVMEAHRGKGSEWRIGAPSYTSKLEREVLRAGYTEDGVADAWTIDVSSSRSAIPDDIYIQRVETIEQMRDMDHVSCISFSKIKKKDDALLEKELLLCLGEQARCLRFIAYDKHTHEPLSAGGVNMFTQLSFAFMWGGCTVPHARGRGIYSALVTQRMLYAQQRGVERLGLYAMRDTSGPIVHKQGFSKHGPVYFWGRDKTPMISKV